MMERHSKKRSSTLPSIIKLLYLTAVISTLLTCIFLWFSKYSAENESPNSSFYLRVPNEPLQTAEDDELLFQRQGDDNKFGDNNNNGIEGSLASSRGETEGGNGRSMEIDFDSLDYNNNNNHKNWRVNEGGSSIEIQGDNEEETVTRNGTGVTMSPTEGFIEKQEQLPSSTMELQMTPTVFTPEEGDSMKERISRVQRFCESKPYFKERSYRMKEMLGFFNQKTNSWIQVSKVVTRQVNEGISAHKVTLEWCPVFKAASTPWMALLMKLKNYLTPDMEHLIRKGKITFVKLAKMFHMSREGPSLRSQNFYEHYYNGTSSSRPNSDLNLSLTIVRHPFERLLSAYRDKLERVQGRSYYHAKFGIPIVERFRFKNNWRQSFNAPLMTLRMSQRFDSEDINMYTPEDMSVDPVSGRYTVFGRRMSPQRRRELESVRPTFSEFVQYLLTMSPTEMDEHWRPIYVDCNACTNSFNLIFKVETMDQDRDYLLGLLGVNDSSNAPISSPPSPPPSFSLSSSSPTTSSPSSAPPVNNDLERIWRRWTNSVGKDIFQSSSTPADDARRKRRAKYFSQLTRESLKALYTLYEPDFQLFGYSPQKYYEMAQS